MGYRYRPNLFYNHDAFFPFADYVHAFADPSLFFDFKFYNSFTYDVSVNETKIAEIYFRLDIDEIEHWRVVYGFFELLESLGGVPEILKSIAGFFIGSYLAFHSSMMQMKTLYQIKTD